MFDHILFFVGCQWTSGLETYKHSSCAGLQQIGGNMFFFLIYLLCMLLSVTQSLSKFSKNIIFKNLVIMSPWFCVVVLKFTKSSIKLNRSGITTNWDIISHMVVNHPYRYLYLPTKWESKSVKLQLRAFSNTAHHVRWHDKFLGINTFILNNLF